MTGGDLVALAPPAQWCSFGPLRVGFDGSVLRPREWTIAQSRWATTLLRDRAPGPILELHCGAGHIGQAAAAWSGRAIVQIDDDPAACAWARRNAATNGIDADVRRTAIETLTTDAAYALVIADPPYVPTADVHRFDEDPRHAIDGGPDGLDGLRACLPVVVGAVRPGGAVVLQVRGPDQAAALHDAVCGLDLDLDPVGTTVLAADRALVTMTRRA